MPRRQRVAVAMAAALECAGAVPATGNAGLATQPENLPSVAAAGYEWGASRSITGVTCDAACQRLVRALNENPGDSIRRKDLLIEAWELGVATKTLPTWWEQPTDFLVQQAKVERTWALGVGGRTKYLEEDIYGTPGPGPAPEAPEPIKEGEFYPIGLRPFMPSTFVTSSGTWGNITAPTDGFHEYAYRPQNHWTVPPDPEPAGWEPTLCTGTPVQPVDTIVLRAPRVGAGRCDPWQQELSSQDVYWRPRVDYRPASATTRSVTHSTERWTSEPDSALALNDRTKAELLTAKYPLYNQLADAALQPDLYTDPRVVAKFGYHQCDRTTPAYHNAGGNLNPHTLRPEAPFTVGAPPPTYPGTTSVRLKDGSTYWTPGRSHDAYDWGTPEGAGKPLPKIDLWSGWGHRFNAARYGWGATDVSETQAALANAVPKDGAYETWIYDWPVPRGANNKACQRRVIVDVSGTTPKGITGSFNMVVPG